MYLFINTYMSNCDLYMYLFINTYMSNCDLYTLIYAKHFKAEKIIKNFFN
jgi:hypothetical protein